MATFTVMAREVSFPLYEVQAENEEEAIAKVENLSGFDLADGGLEACDYASGGDFEILNVEMVEGG